MSEKKIFIQAFGRNDWGLVDFPTKMSNVRIARLEWGNRMGCSYCFPHGYETSNSTMYKNKKSWKFYRKNQYREAPDV